MDSSWTFRALKLPFREMPKNMLYRVYFPRGRRTLLCSFHLLFTTAIKHHRDSRGSRDFTRHPFSPRGYITARFIRRIEDRERRLHGLPFLGTTNEDQEEDLQNFSE